jgi:nucleoside-diphosphate-sugar epimerase
MKKKKRVLVTGAPGHLGFTLTKEIMSQNYDIRAV